MQQWNNLQNVLLRAAIQATVVISFAETASAQLSGHNLKGDFGLKSGSQAPAGIYAGGFFMDYGTDTIKNRFGETLNTQGDLSIQAGAGLLNFVAPAKVLGGHEKLRYGNASEGSACNPVPQDSVREKQS